jgi:hypothetical protein
MEESDEGEEFDMEETDEESLLIEDLITSFKNEDAKAVKKLMREYFNLLKDEE